MTANLLIKEPVKKDIGLLQNSPGLNARVLLVCDDQDTSQIWVHCLNQKGIEAVPVNSAEAAIKQWSEAIPDLIVIDVNSSHLDAIALCQNLREETVIPILLFTPQRSESYILEAYRAGVDECESKPVSPALFMAKVKVWLSRSWTVPTEVLDFMHNDELTLDPVNRQVIYRSGEGVKLTNLEFRLLYLLMKHPGRTIETEFIIDRVWGFYGNGSNHLLKNLVYRLRRKIEPDQEQQHFIHTEPGLGYRFRL